MAWEAWMASGLVVAVLLILIFTELAPHLVMMSALAILSASGILTPGQALAGFSNAGVVTVAAMFIIAAGVQASGGVDYIVKTLLRHPRTERVALARMCLPVSVLSGFLNNTPVVATMIPAVNAWAGRIGVAPSKLMIPLSYAAILGGIVTLIGTSTNLVVNGMFQDLTGEAGFGLFDLSRVGLPVALIGLLFIIVLFPRLLPNRDDENVLSNLRDFTLEVMVVPASPLDGQSIQQAGLRNLRRVFLVEIERDGTTISAVSSEEILRGGDRLIFAGDTQALSDLLSINGIAPPAEQDAPTLQEDKVGRRLVEVVVSPHCEAIGSAIRDAKFRNHYGAVVLAVARHGERVPGGLGNIKLRAGDTLLLEAREAFVTRQQFSKDFLLVNELDHERPRHNKGGLAWMILVGVVAAAGLGVLSMLNAALIGAGLMLFTGCLTVAQAEKSLDLKVLITIAASFALGAALHETGVAAVISGAIVDLSGGNALLLLVLSYLTVSILTEMITNNAAAVLMLPVVLGLTEAASLNPEPFVFAIMIAASASFATPLGYQTNLMVYGPGNYRFVDFIRVGVPMNLLVGVTTVLILALGWPLAAAG